MFFEETKFDLETFIDELGISEEELDFWNSYEIQGLQNSSIEFAAAN